MGSRVVKITILIFWVVMMTWFAIRQQDAISNTESSAIGTGWAKELNDEQGEEWYGIYLVTADDKRMKIGYSVSQTDVRDEVNVITNKSWMQLTVQGKEKTLRTDTKILTDPNYVLISINFVFSTETIKFEVIGDVQGDQMTLLINTAAGESKKVITLDSPPVLPETMMKKAVAEGLEIGKTYDLPMFDPTSFSFTQAKMRIADSEVDEKGNTYYRVTSDFKGIQAETWIDEKGDMRYQKAGNFLVVRESKRDAFNKGWTSDREVKQDIIDTARVVVEKKIPNARTASKVTLRLHEADLSGLLIDGGRQRFDPETGRLIINREILDPAVSYTLPASKDEFGELLLGTPTIQVEDPLVIQTKREIVGKNTDALKTAQRIENWVFENLEKKPLVSIPSARDVLEIKRGDCNEHAALFTALARAAGIPTKIVVGVVYQNGAFYYHAWNSVWVGQWVEIDATFGQFPADATHVRLQEGDLDKQIILLKIIGKLAIDVESAE